jgi:hypothetical protein
MKLLFRPLLIIIVGLCTLAFASCKKKTVYVLSGVIYNKCNEPAANMSVEVRQRSTQYYNSTGGKIGDFKTAPNGAFIFEYKTIDHSETPLSLFIGAEPNAYLIMDSIPANQNIKTDMFLSKLTDIVVNFTTPGDVVYNTADTFYFGFHNYIVGPINPGRQVAFAAPVTVNRFDYQNKLLSLNWGRGLLDLFKSVNSLNHYNEYNVIRYKPAECGQQAVIEIELF